ncbi:DNA adenine methyltransferase [environmental Halophage eHP-8]|nr:DNA adenine methyltransferase [environmental Halophage eHP-8]AFH21933.1 DNA adenine methyltransferase [environmental Halophage eHP-13]
MNQLRGTFPYPGSKTTYANWIIDQIPEHHLYVEPFGGAASVLAAKPRSEIEVYNDINGDCVDFFRAVKDNPDELKRWVEYTPFSRELFEEYVETYPNWPDDIVERAGRFYFIQCAGFGGKLIGSKQKPSFRYSKQSGKPTGTGAKWDEKPSTIEALRKRFKSVNIEHLDYKELIEKYDHENAIFYFDPPYIDVGNDYYQTNNGGFDHNQFVKTLHDMEARWIVSYDHNIPSALSEYPTMERTKAASFSSERPEKVETLTMNYDISGEQVMSELGQQTLTDVSQSG